VKASPGSTIHRTDIKEEVKQEMARRRHKRARRNPKGFKLFGMKLPMLALLVGGGFVLWKYVLNKPAGTVTSTTYLPNPAATNIPGSNA
jgi:hypothetical protein